MPDLQSFFVSEMKKINVKKRKIKDFVLAMCIVVV